MSSVEKARLLVVDDHPVVRRGLRDLLERESDLSVCGESSTVTEALDAVRELKPDLVLCDVMLEGRSGLELTQQIEAHYPDVPVIVVSMYDELVYARRAMVAGARGYVMKTDDPKALLRAVREVLAGGTYFSDSVLDMMDNGHANSQPASVIETLTDRELEVFMLIGQGFAPRHIAEKLNLSPSTVEVYRGRLKEKLGLASSAILLRVAIWWCREHSMS